MRERYRIQVMPERRSRDCRHKTDVRKETCLLEIPEGLSELSVSKILLENVVPHPLHAALKTNGYNLASPLAAALAHSFVTNSGLVVQNQGSRSPSRSRWNNPIISKNLERTKPNVGS